MSAKSLIFCTGNDEKFATAKDACEHHGVQIQQKDVDVTEIQEEDPRKVAIDKAQKAFDALKQPVVITDDSWSFEGLRGFPGVYSHSMNIWFTPEDWLRLTLPLKDRKVTLTQHLIFVDSTGHKIFERHTNGILLKEARGTSKYSSHTVIALDGDDGSSIAEVYERASDKSSRSQGGIWKDFLDWYTTK